MDVISVIESLTTLAAIAAAVLAWLAKLQWSQEYKEAKNEIIKSKDIAMEAKDRIIEELKERISTLETFSPSQIRKYYEELAKETAAAIDNLKSQLSTKESELDEAKKEIETMKVKGSVSADSISRYALLNAERGEILGMIQGATTTGRNIRRVLYDMAKGITVLPPLTTDYEMEENKRRIHEVIDTEKVRRAKHWGNPSQE